MYKTSEINFGNMNNSRSAQGQQQAASNRQDVSCTLNNNTSVAQSYYGATFYNTNTAVTTRQGQSPSTAPSAAIERWISKCSSLSAREAMTILTKSYDITSMVPGPFVVMQGIPGDGMANTIDSQPELICVSGGEENDGNSNNNVATSHHSDSIFRGNNALITTSILSVGEEERGNNIINSMSDQETNESSCISIPSDLPNEIPHLSSGSMDSSQTSNIALSAQEEDEGKEIQTGEDEAVTDVRGDASDGELVCMMDESITSDASSLEIVQHVDTSMNNNIRHTFPDPNNDDNEASTPTAIAMSPKKPSDAGPRTPKISNMNSEFQNRTQTDHGIHLPLPPSAVSIAAMGIGYNSFIPPTTVRSISSPSSHRPTKSVERGGGISAINSKQNDNQNNSCNHLADSFILIDDNKRHEHSQETNDQTNNEQDSKFPASSISSQQNSIDQGESDLLQTDEESSNIDIGKTTSLNNNSRYENISPMDCQSIKEWKRSCRDNEKQYRKDMIDDESASSRNQQQSFLVQDQWWITKNGCLAVFETIPMLLQSSEKVKATIETIEDHIDQNEIDTSLGNKIHFGKIIGEISPGSTVLATEIHCLDEKLLTKPKTCMGREKSTKSAFVSKYEVLKIESPSTGYIVYSFNGYSYLGPGLPIYYVEPEVWMWRVMCRTGAFVRQGLELTSVHTETVPFGSLVRATRKTINSMGLSRVLIESSLPIINDTTPDFRRFNGWVSEALNPLSGQRGKIVQPIPFPVPALYCVTLSDGAVIRSGIELSSPQIGHAPIGSILTVVGRVYSEHPADRCLERLKLAGSGGWISVRLNRSPPRDYLVVELVGIDGRFDPNEAGLYHIERQRQVLQECENNTDEETKNMENLRQSLHRLSTISSINDDDEENGGLANSGELSNTCSSLTSAAVPTLYRSGVAGGSVTSQSVKACGSNSQKDEHCLICLTDQRSATIVHGETGHIACCLACARILKARGDKCPVCRLPIDSIIQQFWA